ncbi:putative sugar efflux transporter [Dirofilaria immitis]
MLKTKTSSDTDKRTWIYSIFATMDSFSFIATLHFAFILTVNRFVAMNFSKFNVFFESVKFYFLIAFVWLSVFALALTEFCYCTKMFVVSNLQWLANCTKKTPASGEIFLTFRYVWTLALPILMFLMYISIFYNIHRKRKITTDQPKTNATSKVHVGHHAKTRINSGKYDRSMLIQAAM